MEMGTGLWWVLVQGALKAVASILVVTRLAREVVLALDDRPDEQVMRWYYADAQRAKGHRSSAGYRIASCVMALVWVFILLRLWAPLG